MLIPAELTTEGRESTEEKSAVGAEKLFQKTEISGVKVSSFRFPVSLPPIPLTLPRHAVLA
jgi:hypothetical protein